MFLSFTVPTSNIFLLDFFFSQRHNFMAAVSPSLWSVLALYIFVYQGWLYKSWRATPWPPALEAQSFTGFEDNAFCLSPLPSSFPYFPPVSSHVSPQWLWVVSNILAIFSFLLHLVLLLQGIIYFNESLYSDNSLIYIAQCLKFHMYPKLLIFPVIIPVIIPQLEIQHIKKWAIVMSLLNLLLFSFLSVPTLPISGPFVIV